jgi:8-oxo-dGTP diphosphatase/2-hydroxy-dATP diphosphatase
VRVQEMTKAGILDFEFENDPKVLEVHIFSATKFEGEPRESEEMSPRWFHIDEIPYDDMWSDDEYWVPLLLGGKKFKGRFLFDKPSSIEHSAKIINKELREVEYL